MGVVVASVAIVGEAMGVGTAVGVAAAVAARPSLPVSKSGRSDLRADTNADAELCWGITRFGLLGSGVSW